MVFNPGGYCYSFDPGGVRQEADTMTCNHCNRVVIIHKKVDDCGGHCRLCDKFICSECVDANHCVPFMAKVEQEEERYYRWARNFGR